MRILQVAPVYYPELQYGGPPEKIHALSRGIAARGHEVRVVTLHSDKRGGGRATLDGIAVSYLPWRGGGGWRVPLDPAGLRAEVRRADLVHCYGLYNLLSPGAAALALRAGRPYLLEPLGMYVPRTGKVGAKRLYHRLCTSWMARRAAGVIATSPNELEELSGLVGPRRLILRRNGLDLARFGTLPDGAAFRARLGIGADERVVLYLGRISPIKNLEQLLLAFAALAPGRARLVLVGPLLESDYEARLRRLIAARDLASSVILAGPAYDEEKYAALAAADLFVLPSLAESFGNAAAEAVAAGVPVLLTEGCGIAPLIHGRAGLAVPGTVPALAEGLRTMLDEPERRATLTSRRGEVLRELSWDEPLEALEHLYARLVRATPATARGRSLELIADTSERSGDVYPRD